LHQDDWLASSDCLAIFIAAFKSQPNAQFAFCKNTAIQPNGKELTLQYLKSLLTDMHNRPNHLVRANVIGPPSNTMLRKTVDVKYDEDYIWLVDVDYYVSLLKKGYSYIYIDQHLVSIGLHDEQTTVFCRNNEDVIIKENIWFAEKIGTEAFSDILIYDYYWRLLRNYKIRSISDLVQNGVNSSRILPIIENMLLLQKKVPLSLLKLGVVSKMLMTISYLFRSKSE
jgi:hypothetical protein